MYRLTCFFRRLGSARRLFPQSSAVGHRFGLGNDPAYASDFTIVGAKDAKYVSLAETAHKAAYFLWQQRVQNSSNLNVRYSGDPAAVMLAVRKAVTQVNPGVVVSNVASLGEQVDASIGSRQLIAQISALFSLLATFLVCIGLYSLMSCTVARRTSEIGVRMARGAGRLRVQWMVLREILALAALGLIIGIPVALLGMNRQTRRPPPHRAHPLRCRPQRSPRSRRCGRAHAHRLRARRLSPGAACLAHRSPDRPARRITRSSP
ncbi:MAG TPA: FtsX-like permease family protein [Acidobacteriaceae bacterium]